MSDAFDPEQPKVDRPEGWPLYRIRIAVSLGILLGAIDGGIIAPILPAISRELGAGAGGLSWLASGYFLGTALAAPVWGGIGDSRGHSFVVTMGLLILTVSTIACAATGIVSQELTILSNDLQFAASRFAQGIGSAAIFTGGFALLSETASARRRVRSSGLFSGVFAISTMIGPVAAGMVSDHAHYTLGGVEIAGWRFVFIAQLPVALLALLLMPMRPPRSSPAKGRFDYFGLGLVALIAILCMSLVSRTRSVEGGLLILATVAGIAIGLAALVRVERRAERPLLPPDLLAVDAVRNSCLAAAMTAGALTCFGLSIPGSLQAGAGLSAAGSGAFMAALSFGYFVGTVVNGRVVGRTGRAREASLFWAGLCLLALGFLAVQPPGERNLLFIILFVIGVGFGPLQPMQFIMMQLAVPDNRQGTAAGMLNFFRRLGAWAGGAIGGLVLAHNLNKAPGSIAGEQWPYVLPSILCILFLVANIACIWRFSRDRIPD
ncbi:MAG TPA: MFS transporter [Allosphingosinicella sp.]